MLKTENTHLNTNVRQDSGNDAQRHWTNKAPGKYHKRVTVLTILHWSYRRCKSSLYTQISSGEAIKSQACRLLSSKEEDVCLSSSQNAGKGYSLQPGAPLPSEEAGFTHIPQSLCFVYPRSFLQKSWAFLLSPLNPSLWEMSHVLYNSQNNFCDILGQSNPDSHKRYVYLNHSPYTLNVEACFWGNRTHHYGKTQMYVVKSLKVKHVLHLLFTWDWVNCHGETFFWKCAVLK